MDNNNEKTETSQLDFSLRLNFMSSFLGLISEALEIWSLIETIEKEKETKAKNELEHQLEEMQNQINELTNEINQLKKQQSNNE